MTPCRWVSGSRRFERSQCLHFQDSSSPRITACTCLAQYTVRCMHCKVRTCPDTPYLQHFLFLTQWSFYSVSPCLGPYNKASADPNYAWQYDINRRCSGDAETSALISGDFSFEYRSSFWLLWLNVSQDSSVRPDKYLDHSSYDCAASFLLLNL
jgi:hypothetical protein